jgi:formylglycine-generating enzyme required for sulfatase activity
VSTTTISGAGPAILSRFNDVRRSSIALCKPLSAEDMMVQSCPEASPAKWHLAHTAWFFESFVLREFLPGYKLFNQDFPWLFNSYYEGFSAFPEKRLRSSFSRPGIEEILGYREHVDSAMERLFEREPEPEALRRIELGANHEEQHQELLLTDILNAFFTNPLRPKYRDRATPSGVNRPLGTPAGNEGTREQGIGNAGEDARTTAGLETGATRGHGTKGAKVPLTFRRFDGGLKEAGNAGYGFCFDNEMPRHRVWLEPFGLADRLVTCGEYAKFMADGGYRKPELWLSAGWDAVKANGWRAPLYWTEQDGAWTVFTLRGEQPLESLADVPVSQVSYYEADAYARWAGLRLPTEFEWEAAVEGQPIEGNLLDSGNLMPIPSTDLVQSQDGAKHSYGDCWVWTSSAYLGYPGFKPLDGALGEYNGKFMSGQMVLRGGSCVTPVRHIRSTYRNFFSPETRWQFSGIRLAT